MVLSLSQKENEFGRLILEDFEVSQKKIRMQNKRPDFDAKKDLSSQPKYPEFIDTSASRKFEEILANEEKEEKKLAYESAQKKAASWCPLDHEHGPNCEKPPSLGCAGNHSAEIAIYEKSTPEKLLAIKTFKSVGNDLFKEGNYGQAAVEYRRGIVYLDYTFPETDEETEEADTLKVQLFLNLSICKEKLEDFHESITLAQRVLSMDKRNSKAYFRIGTAKLCLDDFEGAKLAFKTALEISPNDSAVISKLQEISRKEKIYAEKSKELAKKIITS
jgi:tetratricopeptide (TPR) repeat protein